MHIFSSWPAVVLLLVGSLLSASTVKADVTRIEESDAAVTYDHSQWRTVGIGGGSGGTVEGVGLGVASGIAGAQLTVTFTGTGIAWIGPRSPSDVANAYVYVDGRLRDHVSTFAPTYEAQAQLFRIGGLADTSHTLTIVPTGGTTPTGRAREVIVDAFDIESGPHKDFVQEDDFSVTYSGNWITVEDPSLSGGSARAARENFAIANVHFYGTGIEWIGYRCACAAGIAPLNYGPDGNGGKLAVKHTYSATPEPQAVIYRLEGLPLGQHDLHIWVSGQGIGNNPWVVVDAFRILNGSGGSGGADNSPPTVTLTAPEPNALVTGSVTLAAEAADDAGVTLVEFYAGDSASQLIGTDTTAPYAITRDTSQLPSGSTYRLWARAIDAAGNLAETGGTFATVQHVDRTRPVVTITEPANGSTVSGTITLTATASDERGLRSGYLYRDSHAHRYPVESAPASMQVNTMAMPDGIHVLGARAADTARNSTDAEVSVIVDNSVQPGMVRIDDAKAGLVLSDGWTTRSLNEAWGAPAFHWGSATVTDRPGATATFTFDGIGVRWIGYSCLYECGDANVSIDGGPPVRVLRTGGDLGEPYRISGPVYTSPTLPSGRHTLTITVQSYHPAGAGGAVFIDAFEVLK